MTPPNPAGRPTPTDPLPHAQRRARRPAGASAPLRRSRERRVVAGVCGGIAAFVGARPATVRAIWVVSMVPSLGFTLLAYPAMWWLLPLEAEPASGATPG
jgi:phage shock protein PspC (stress-responsive transcriptional regulator)